MKKGIITVVGKDQVGIIAKVCTYLAENDVNILDISQTIVQGYFNMMMIVNHDASSKAFNDLADELAALKYLKKPFDLDDFVNMVRTTLHH